MTTIYKAVENAQLNTLLLEGVINGTHYEVVLCPQLGVQLVYEEDPMDQLLAIIHDASLSQLAANRLLDGAVALGKGETTNLEAIDLTKFEKVGFSGLSGGRLKAGPEFGTIESSIDREFSSLLEELGPSDKSAEEVGAEVEAYLRGKGITTFDVNGEETDAVSTIR